MTHPLQEIRETLNRIEDFMKENEPLCWPEFVNDFEYIRSQLISDYVLVKRADVPEGLGEALGCAEHDYRVGNTINPSDFDDLVQAATALHNAIKEDK